MRERFHWEIDWEDLADCLEIGGEIMWNLSVLKKKDFYHSAILSPIAPQKWNPIN